MRLCEAVARIGNAEVTVMRVGAQAVGFEVFLAVMADGDALLGTRALYRCCCPALALQLLARGGFGGGFTRRRFFLRGGLGGGTRGRLARFPARLLFGH